MTDTIVIHAVISQLIKLGVAVTIECNDKGVWYNLNTEAKSHMHARETIGGTLVLDMRYDEQREIETFDELCEAFDSCLGTTAYHNSDWGTAMRKCGHWPDK